MGCALPALPGGEEDHMTQPRYFTRLRNGIRLWSETARLMNESIRWMQENPFRWQIYSPGQIKLVDSGWRDV